MPACLRLLLGVRPHLNCEPLREISEHLADGVEHLRLQLGLVDDEFPAHEWLCLSHVKYRQATKLEAKLSASEGWWKRLPFRGVLVPAVHLLQKPVVPRK